MRKPEPEFKTIVRKTIARIQRNEERGKGCLLSPREVQCLCLTLLADSDAVSESYDE